MLELKPWLSFEDVSGWNLALGPAFTLSAAWLIQRLLEVQSALKGIGYHPGYRHVIGAYSLLGRILPFGIPYFNRKIDIHDRTKRVCESFSLKRGIWTHIMKFWNKAYKKFNSDIFSATLLHPTVQVTLTVGDATVAKVQYYEDISFIMKLTKFIPYRKSLRTGFYSQNRSRHTNQSQSLVLI
jgi:hypothetical protein